MNIDKITALVDEGKMRKNYDRPVIDFSSNTFKNTFSVSDGKIKPRSGILSQNWFKDSIPDGIGVSDDD